jgi:hypothetical protein
MKTCEGCGEGDERAIHLKAMDEYHEHFTKEHHFLLQEYKRMQTLLKDVIFYNLGTVASKWKGMRSWETNEFILGYDVELHTQRYRMVPTRGGRHCEKADFPIYYQGDLEGAPPLPPAIVLDEVKRIQEEVRVAEANCAAPYEWAPGGRKYEQMLRESEGVAAYRAISSKGGGGCDDGRRARAAFQDGLGLRLGDDMERSPATATETTAEDVLGRVRGDRSLVRT